METYSVMITTRPLGITFNHLTDEYGNGWLEISQMTINSPASNLGVCIGDRLIAINNKSISNMSSSFISKTLHNHPLPFNVTFKSSSNRISCINKEENQYKQCLNDYVNMASFHDNNNLSTNANHGSLIDFDFLSVFKLQQTSNHFINESYVTINQCQQYDEYNLYGNGDINYNENVPNKMDIVHEIQSVDNTKNDIVDETDSVDNIVDVVDNDGNKIESDCEDPIYLYINNMDHIDLFNLFEYTQSMILLSTKGLKCGYHEWSVKILKCDVFKQEIGIISNNQIDLNKNGIDNDGIKGTKSFGARACYGNELCSNKCYYASYNEDNKERINKDLSNKPDSPRNIGWCTNDVIKVCMDLDKSQIKFYLNEQKVRKMISLQPKKTYYPMIWFSGNCQYELVHYQ